MSLSYIKDFNEALVHFGLAPLARNLEDKFTMYVKNHEDTKFNKKFQPLPCIAMEKKDGISTVCFNFYGQFLIFSRTGKRLTNVAHLEAYLSSLRDLQGKVVFCELCNDTLSLEALGGCVNPLRVDPLDESRIEAMKSSYLCPFDMINCYSFLKGEEDISFRRRISTLQTTMQDQLPMPVISWCNLEEEVEALYSFIVAQGGEGVVRALPEEGWLAGHKNQRKTKRVRGYDVDLEVIGIEVGKVGTKREGQLNKVIVRWVNQKTFKTVRLPVDGRFTDAQRVEWFNNPELIIGKIVHVHALQLGSKGSMRLPKVRTVRMDKFIGDM